MTISLRFNDSDIALIKKYAALSKLSVSELIRQSVLERIEDEYDLEAYKVAMIAYRENPLSYSHAEVKQVLELV